jgi:predicted cation transporter
MSLADGANIVILLAVLAGPFFNRWVEHNLEGFLFVMGLFSAIASGVLGGHLVRDALVHPIPITLAVLAAGLIFARVREPLANGLESLAGRVRPALLVGAATIILGLASSVITAIIASLVLVEFISALRLERVAMVRAVVLACYAIGLGAALTPIGEPLSTIAVAKLGRDFWFLMRELGVFVIPGVVAFGVVANLARAPRAAAGAGATDDTEAILHEPAEGLRQVVERAVRVYVFVMALTLLGEGFKPLIDRYVIGLDARLLYWINMISAVLDNATLTAAEISPKMDPAQVRAVLMGLLVSGGMLIPGNIPNIIAAGKLKIGSREWARIAVPIGLATLVVYFVFLFVL